MRRLLEILIVLGITFTGCVTQFIPDISEEKEAIVIEARVTDKNETYEVKISKLQPVYAEDNDFYEDSYSVSVLDDDGYAHFFSNKGGGRYLSDSTEFIATADRKYKLRVEGGGGTYESRFVEMIPVPAIDSVYAGPEYNNFYRPGESTWGYQVYLDSHDPSGKCRFYKWTFAETWEFRYPYDSQYIINRVCWKSNLSADINILSTSSLEESKVVRQPLTFITKESDRLIIKYSILVRQYSLSEEEFIYRENIRRTSFDAGGLYDAIPGALEGNIMRIDKPSEQVLGFFGVSAVSEKRIFIENVLVRFPDFYAYCTRDTILQEDYEPNAYGSNVYILSEYLEPEQPAVYIITTHGECLDCSMIGTAIKPDYWDIPGQKKSDNLLFNEER